MPIYTVVWEKFITNASSKKGILLVKAESQKSLEEVVVQSRATHYQTGSIVLRIKSYKGKKKAIPLRKLQKFLCT